MYTTYIYIHTHIQIYIFSVFTVMKTDAIHPQVVPARSCTVYEKLLEGPAQQAGMDTPMAQSIRQALEAHEAAAQQRRELADRVQGACALAVSWKSFEISYNLSKWPRIVWRRRETDRILSFKWLANLKKRSLGANTFADLGR